MYEPELIERRDDMEKIILELEVDEKTATAYRNAPPEKQEKVRERARLSMQRVLLTPEEIGAEFDRITARASAYAKEKGWTDEMNEALLRGEYDD